MGLRVDFSLRCSLTANCELDRSDRGTGNKLDLIMTKECNVEFYTEYLVLCYIK